MTRWSVVVAALAVVGTLGACGESDAEPDDSSSRSSVVELTVPAAPAGRCMMPNVTSLQAQDFAFEGVVRDVIDGSATLDVVRTFEGDDTQVVRVAVPDPGLRDLVLAVEFKQERTYLVSSLDGQVSVCGLSGLKDEPLTELYQEAYQD